MKSEVSSHPVHGRSDPLRALGLTQIMRELPDENADPATADIKPSTQTLLSADGVGVV